MKKVMLCMAIVLVIAVAGCKPKEAGVTATVAPSGGDVVATIGDQTITAKDLDDAVKPMLQGIEMKIYQLKKRTLDSLVEEKLVEAAAKKDGISVEDYIKKEIEAKVIPPTDAEVKKVYEERKGKDAPPFDQVKAQIADYLAQSQRMRLQGELVARLKTEGNVKILMEPPRVTVAVGDAPALGPKDAKVTFIEFSDYECPFCGREREVIWQVVDKYKDKVRYVFKDFPLSFHRSAQKAAEAAHCAGDQGKYWEYNKMAYANQKDLSVESLKKYAKDVGIDTAKFDTCLDSGAQTARVKKSLEEGSAAGVSGTPAYFINGIMLSGAQPPEAFGEVIDAELKK